MPFSHWLYGRSSSPLYKIFRTLGCSTRRDLRKSVYKIFRFAVYPEVLKHVVLCCRICRAATANRAWRDFNSGHTAKQPVPTVLTLDTSAGLTSLEQKLAHLHCSISELITKKEQNTPPSGVCALCSHAPTRTSTTHMLAFTESSLSGNHLGGLN